MDQNTSENIKKEVFQSLNEEFLKTNFDRHFDIDDSAEFKNKLLLFSEGFDSVCILNNNFPTEHNKAEYIAALGHVKELVLDREKGAFVAMKAFFDENAGEWIPGFLSYDLKNDVEDLSSSNEDQLNFPVLHFFLPDNLILIKEKKVSIKSVSSDAYEIFKAINDAEIHDSKPLGLEEAMFSSRPDESGYMKSIQSLIKEIEQGNIYEINFCRELLLNCEIDPYKTAISLSKEAPAPFSCFYKYGDKFLICSSPERFLLKSGQTLISQPIKGTRKRSSDLAEDENLKRELQYDRKERAENVMIVDLVRNDLSHTAEIGSVTVPDLFKIHTFSQVHQMISTVKSTLKKESHFVEAIRHCFPMGSMTGAPKLRAMKLIEEYEQFRRGLFSGSVGIISPDQNFDFNVVIRSILYNSKSNTVSIRTGSAITALCTPEKEWEECQLKAKAMIGALQRKNEGDV